MTTHHHFHSILGDIDVCQFPPDRVPIHNIVAVADVLPGRNNSPPMPATAGEVLLPRNIRHGA